MEEASKPRVLLLYFTYSQQTLRVMDVVGEVMRERGCEVQDASIEFTDRRWADRFSRFPFRRPWQDVFGMLPAQLRRATGEIRIPDTARATDYDLVCIGSPTWWLTTNMPIRSFLKSQEAGALLAGTPFATFVVCRRYWRNNLETVNKLATEKGGRLVDAIYFTYLGNQVRSLLSLISYLSSGEYNDRYWGVRIPPTNLRPEQLEEARTFAASIADKVFAPSRKHDVEEVQTQ